jgi:transcriptional regulator with XRE-family HTH domain
MGTYQSGGRVLLRAWVAAPGHSQEKLADLLDVVQSTVSLWTRAHTRPEYHHRILLHLICGIPIESWMTAEEMAKVRRITRLFKELAPTGTEG